MVVLSNSFKDIIARHNLQKHYKLSFNKNSEASGFHQDPLFWKSVVAEWCATLEEEKIRRSRCRQWWNDATNEGSTQTSFCGLKSLPESIIRMSFRQFLL
ncbi:hypothetical protein HN51_009578 [Arachis hypogaea]